MPLEVDIDHEKRLVVLRLTGRFGDAEFLAADDRFRANPAIKPEYDQLLDLRRAQAGELTRGGVQSLTARTPFFSRSSRRAIVAPSDLGFGMARMFEQMRAGEAGEIRTFRTMEDARAWLEETDEG